MRDRRDALKLLGGAAALMCPTCLSAASSLASESKGAPHGAAPHWGYEGPGGPEHWSDLSPANRVCGMGFQQSPIDLAKGHDASLGVIDIDYRSMPLHVVNNGHTIQVNCKPGSGIRLEGTQYKLLQYHFHHPSEHALEGKRFDLEVHFVHASDDGTLAVLGVFFDQGEHNPALGRVWNAMPAKSGEEKTGGSLSPAMFLPEDRLFYRYYGSLTTPPCSEKVIWSVFAQPITASSSQVKEFANLFPMNARPLQRQNRRHLLKSS